MERTWNDDVFGVMTYKHKWYKTDTIVFAGRQYNVTIAAKAYSNKPITDEQRESYKRFIESQPDILSKSASLLFEYLNSNAESLAETWFGARTICSTEELAGIVTPKTILFKQDGTALLLLDCVWDEEGGFAVQFHPNWALGSQDMFL